MTEYKTCTYVGYRSYFYTLIL